MTLIGFDTTLGNINQAIVFRYYVQHRSPRLIYQVVGQSRDDVLTAVHRREAIIPARNSNVITPSPCIPSDALCSLKITIQKV